MKAVPRLPFFVEPVPLDLAWKDPEANLAAIEREVRSRLACAPEAPSEARLFLFPELTLTGFVTQAPPAYRCDPPDPPLARLKALARELRTGLAVGFPEVNPLDSRRPFNTLAVISPDGAEAARYRKTHLFTFGEMPESTVYAAGEGGTIFEYRGWKIGLAICFDMRFSGLFHAYAKAGADLVLAAACWVDGPHKTYQYKTLGSAHAILAQAYVAAVNRSGRDPSYGYDGSAYVFSPFGEDLYKGSAMRLDPEELEACRRLVVRPADRPSYPLIRRA